MSHSEIVISGGADSNSDSVAEPITLSSVIVTIISIFVFIAGVVVWALAFFTPTIRLTFELFTHNLAGNIITAPYLAYGTSTAGGRIAPPGQKISRTFEKTEYSWYGSSGVLTVRSDDWTVDVYNETVVWLYWYIPYSRLYNNNYFGFQITGFATAAANGEREWNRFYYDSNPKSINVIKVPSSPRNFAIGFGNVSIWDVDAFSNRTIPGYLMEGLFNSNGQSVITITIMKLDDVYSSMKHLVRRGQLAYFCYCDVFRFACVKYYTEGIATTETINDFWNEFV